MAEAEQRTPPRLNASSLHQMDLRARRPLGRTGLAVCPIVLGTMQFGWTMSDVHAMRLLDAYVGGGGNLIDTANMYGGDQSVESFEPNRAHVGVSEDMIGRWLSTRGGRDEVILSTKVRARMWDGDDGEGLTRRHIVRAVEDSLRRLRTDRLDVLYAHWPDPGSDPQEWLGAFADLKAEGKIRHVGTSNFCGFGDFGDLLTPVLELARSAGLPGVEVEQTRYNLLNRSDFESGLQAIAIREGLGIVTYSSLASGFLAGRYPPGGDATGARAAFVSQYGNERGWAILGALERIARAHDVPVAAVALAWILSREGVSATIVGPESIQSLPRAPQLPSPSSTRMRPTSSPGCPGMSPRPSSSNGRAVAGDGPGSGPALVMAHGMELDRRLFAPQQADLSPQFRSIAYDLRARTLAGEEPYGLDDLVSDFEWLLDDLGIARCVFIGMSMGGFVAIRAALRCPGRVAGVVLIGSSAVPYPAGLSNGGRSTRRCEARVSAGGAGPGRCRTARSELTRRRRPELVHEWAQRIQSRTGTATWLEFAAWAWQDDLRPSLGALTVPLLVIHGEEDQAVPLEMALESCERVPGSRLMVLRSRLTRSISNTRGRSTGDPQFADSVLHDDPA